MTRGGASQRGFALLVVLWTVGLLAFVVSAMLADGRTDMRLAEATRDGAVAQAAADGAVQRAIYLLLAGAIAADGTPRPAVLGAARVRLTIANEGGRINPNFSAPPLLAAVLVNAGLDPALAQDLAQRIVDWRTATPFAMGGGQKVDAYRQAGLPYGPADHPFLSVAEVGQVNGMPPALLARIAPLLSVYQAGDPRQDAAQAETGGVVQLAQMMNHGSVLSGLDAQDQVVRITADATAPSGVRFVRTAVVRIVRAADGAGAAGGAAPAWAVLEWR